MPLLGHNKHFWNMPKSWISVFFVKLSALTGSQQANKKNKKEAYLCMLLCIPNYT